jgi:hypothetical protein
MVITFHNTYAVNNKKHGQGALSGMTISKYPEQEQNMPQCYMIYFQPCLYIFTEMVFLFPAFFKHA